MTEQQRMARPLAEVDPEVYAAIVNETVRQNSRLELIASENFTSEAILEATGSVMTNKYAEGYPGRRYYGGCENRFGGKIFAGDQFQPGILPLGFFDDSRINLRIHFGQGPRHPLLFGHVTSVSPALPIA